MRLLRSLPSSKCECKIGKTADTAVSSQLFVYRTCFNFDIAHLCTDLNCVTSHRYLGASLPHCSSAQAALMTKETQFHPLSVAEMGFHLTAEDLIAHEAYCCD